MGAIASSFGLPHRASKSCLHREDLTSFDFDFFYEEIDNILEFVQVTVGSLSYNVKVRINFVSEQGLSGTSNTQDESNSDNGEEDYGDW